jgi:PAS domain S-box-containing protein
VDYITKPLQKEEVLARVRTHLQLHNMQKNLEELVRERTEKLRESQAEVRESEIKYRTLFESSTDPIILLDGKNIFDCNLATLQLFDCPDREQFLNSHFADWSPEVQPHDRLSKEAADEAIAVAFREGSNFFEWTHKRANGEQFIAEVLFSAMKIDDQALIQATVRDITERRQMEEERILLNRAIEQMSEVVVITDANAVMQFVNPAFECHTGYSREEAIGRNLNILQSGKHSSGFYKKMWDTLLSLKPWHGHLINKKKDGTLTEEKVTISPVVSSEGRITNFVAVQRDVTKEVSLEKQLRQAVKLEAMGTLASGIVHDFNNILSAIIGFGELAQIELPRDHPVREDLEKIVESGKRAAELTKQILTFSREGESEFKSIAIQPLVKEVIKLLKSTLPASVEIKQNIAGDCAPVFADPTQIHQVVMNLCTNAKLAMKDGDGTLTVSLRQAELPCDFSLGRRLPPDIKPGSYIDLEVSDTGCGMEEQLIEKIFDPFFTTRKKEEGTGLGLSVVYGIVKKHSGAISVSSTPGQGTSFHVYLPVAGLEITAEMASDIVSHGGVERILIVDDEPFIVHVIKRQLEELGYHITGTSDSKNALEFIRANPADFDLLIIDQFMPGLTGTALTAEIHKIRADLPVILCTAHGHEISEAEVRKVDIKTVIYKPIVGDALFRAVRSTLDAEKSGEYPTAK